MNEVSDLADRECVPCRGGIPPLKGDELAGWHAKLGEDWSVVDEHHLERTFRFKNFQEALDFANRVGALAESVNHHPDLHVAWGHCQIQVWTHKVDGLTETDFVFAAKAARLL